MRRPPTTEAPWAKPMHLLPEEEALAKVHGELLESFRETLGKGDAYLSAPWDAVPPARDAYQGALHRFSVAQDRLYEAKRHVADALRDAQGQRPR